ncbi:MAG: hypothetical protein ABFS86_12130 [Planctomycetota bacterium]
MRFPKTRRGLFVCATLILVSAAIVWAATDVTVSKSDSKYASASMTDGTYWTSVYLMESDNGLILSYGIWERQTTYPYWVAIEQGYGEIDKSDGSIGSTSAWVDVDTSDIATVGDGGTIDVEWTETGLYGYESTSKNTFIQGNVKTISFGGYSNTTAEASGTVLGEDFLGTGMIGTNKGKTIRQVK